MVTRGISTNIEILNLKQIAQLLGVSQATIRRYMNCYNMPYNQIAPRKKITFDKAQVLRWWSQFNHPYTKFLRRSRGL